MPRNRSEAFPKVLKTKLVRHNMTGAEYSLSHVHVVNGLWRLRLRPHRLGDVYHEWVTDIGSLSQSRIDFDVFPAVFLHSHNSRFQDGWTKVARDAPQ